jgi:hypothetical protein
LAGMALADAVITSTRSAESPPRSSVVLAAQLAATSAMACEWLGKESESWRRVATRVREHLMEAGFERRHAYERGWFLIERWLEDRGNISEGGVEAFSSWLFVHPAL